MSKTQSYKALERYRPYKYCIVPCCTSTTIKTPGKIFLSVPKDALKRKAWTRAMRRDEKLNKELSCTSTLWCCEDHFSLPEDMANYWEWQLTNNVKKFILKPNVVPHLFDCQKTCPVLVKKSPAKKRRLKSNNSNMGNQQTRMPSRPKAKTRSNRASRSQRLRRAREKKASVKPCKPQQIIYESLQDCSQDMAVMNSASTISEETLKLLTMIKTEFQDPDEINLGQEESQYETSINFMTEIDASKINERLILPVVKIEPGIETSFPTHTNRTSTIESKSLCGCSENISELRHLCERYLELVQQDSELCLCKTGNQILPEDMKPVRKLMKKLSRLLNFDNGKHTCDVNEIDDLARLSF